MSAPLKIPLKEIEAVTNSFDEENFIGKGFLGNIYKGQLSVSGELIDVAIRRLDNSFRLQELAFEKEISVLSQFKHENMVSIVGFCYENDEMLIINKRVARGSLRRHLSHPALTWMRRLKISVGAVRALCYLHNDVGHNFSVIHHNINSNTILLDENWEAKISGFEYSMRIPAGNLDLAYEKLGMGTYKSDVFSMGIVLFELLCGREAFVSKEDNSFQASSAIFHYENRELHKFVDPDLFSQMDQLSFNIFSKTAYNCLTQQRAPPSMNEILKRLERALKVQQMYENNEHTTVPIRTIPDHLKLKLESLKHMRIRLDVILAATGNFSKDHIVSSGGFGSVYTAELEHADKEYCLETERENEREVPKKRSIVAIKNIEDTEDEISEQGFYAEIEMLTSCKHSNIISLVGFCDERGTMILIYEYASNGNLSYYLQNMKGNHNDGWAQRLKICIDAAKGLSFLHTTNGDRKTIVHRDIKSANILLDGNLEAKISDFGLSIIPKEHHNTPYSRNVVGTWAYMDPQYRKDAKLKNKSDVYSFGVVLFEILCGTVAYDKRYNNKGLALLGREHFNNRTIMELVDPKIKEEITKTFITSVKGPNQESLDTFTKIAYECLTEAQDDRPTMEDVLKELQKALLFQESREDILQLSPEDITFAINDNENYGFFEKYIGKVSRANGNTTTITVRDHKDDSKFKTEIEVGRKYKHENVISLLGYYEEEGKRVIVYEHALNGRLSMHLDNPHLTWAKRLKICIDIARGLQFLHGGLVTGEMVIHNNIKSRNILLDADMNIAKIDGLGFSAILPADGKDAHYPVKTPRQLNELLARVSASEESEYMGPETRLNLLFTKEGDIYSFGIVLFEVMLQRLACSFESKNNGYYFGGLIKDLYKKGNLDEIMFESQNEQIAPQSMAIYRRIAIQCLHDNREERPTASEVLIQLKLALEIQEKGIDIIRISFEDIKCATDNFNNEKCLGRGAHGKIYKGQLPRTNQPKIIVAKRWDGGYSQGDHEFNRELEIHFKFTHTNVLGLEGYCDEMGEKITVYEYAPNGSLDRWLNDTSLTWKKRLEICVDVATGLRFLHGNALRREGVLHMNIKSSNILLSGDWKAKIASFRLSLIRPSNQKFDDIIIKELVGVINPRYMGMDTKCTIRKEYDIYSFGVVLFEIFCGRLACPCSVSNEQYLIPLAKNYYEKNKLDELMFEGIKVRHVLRESLSTFVDIAYKCLHDDPNLRPTASDVLEQLQKALELQVDWENWESKLPSDYKEIFQQSKTPEILNTEKKEILYNMLSKGIFIQKGKVWFWLDSNNNKNKAISATLFTYQNQSLQRWRRIKKSRFSGVSLMKDISNLKIQISIKAQFLTPNVHYGVFLVFKFDEPNKTSGEQKYVNLKYNKENQTLHAYFASWRDDEWMMIELYRFFNDEDAHDFEVLLESFSRYYCRSDSIYVEGIEFRAIDNVIKHEEIDKLKDAQEMMIASSLSDTHSSDDDSDDISNDDDSRTELSEMNGKIIYMLPAKKVLDGSTDVKLFKVEPSQQSRFGEVVEVLSQQVICFYERFYEDKLSLDTNYSCYLIFKLSEKCRGLYSPVKVRGLIHRGKKGNKDIYFRSPHAWNIHDINNVPKEREDGWMEVNLWNFNPKPVTEWDLIKLDFKLISYEGTLSGLVICGLEFRPVV